MASSWPRAEPCCRSGARLLDTLTGSAVPPGIVPAEVRGVLERLPGVSGIHDLHIWPMITTETALTCHLVLPSGHPGDEFTRRLTSELRAKFGIGHATVQIETGGEVTCALAPEHLV